jgi:putative intracellular protease/amidase
MTCYPPASIVASVCTGSLMTGAAGVLHGRRATSHWAPGPGRRGVGEACYLGVGSRRTHRLAGASGMVSTAQTASAPSSARW